jgi:transposase
VSVPEPRDEGIELVLPGGCVVRISRGFDAATLDRLLTVIERRS